MNTADPAVNIDGLVKHYGKVEAVRGIDLQVARGEVFGFLGPNGSGKSTTIRCLLGLLRPTAGKIGAFGWRVVCVDLTAYGSFATKVLPVLLERERRNSRGPGPRRMTKRNDHLGPRRHACERM